MYAHVARVSQRPATVLLRPTPTTRRDTRTTRTATPRLIFAAAHLPPRRRAHSAKKHNAPLSSDHTHTRTQQTPAQDAPRGRHNPPTGSTATHPRTHDSRSTTKAPASEATTCACVRMRWSFSHPACKPTPRAMPPEGFNSESKQSRQSTQQQTLLTTHPASDPRHDTAHELTNVSLAFVNYVKLFYSHENAPSRKILVNGRLGPAFELASGVAQGCPLSPLLFLVITEALTRLIVNDKNIKGIQVGNESHKISQYADDFLGTPKRREGQSSHIKAANLREPRHQGRPSPARPQKRRQTNPRSERRGHRNHLLHERLPPL